MATMRAIVKTEKGPGHIEVRDMPIPEPDETEVLIRVNYAGICGTDIHIWHDAFTYYPPVILGHEFSGTVAAVGKKGNALFAWQPRGCRTACKGLRSVSVMPEWPYPDLRPEKVARLGHERRIRRISGDAGAAPARHT